MTEAGVVSRDATRKEKHMPEPILDPKLMEAAAILSAAETGGIEHFAHLLEVITGQAPDLTKKDWIAILSHARQVRDAALKLLAEPAAIQIEKG
jgi:hypothetical protein